MVFCTGPDSFVRALGAVKLQALVHSLDIKSKAEAFNRLLPTVMLFVDDPTPSVQAIGIQTLHDLTQGAVIAIGFFSCK